ncbi:MAG: CotH kinase family protein, partial [Pseudobutyrivibrio sp.]|nr:CotH kinase family protein [Pseudobutyrivibrio sp.]
RVEIFDDNQNLLDSQACGIRVQGDGSRGKLPRNLKLISREEYSGSRYLQTDLLGNGEDLHKYVIFGGSDDNIFKIKDYMANTMESELNFATMDFKPCICFLEGEYCVTYYLTEYYYDDYVESYYNVPIDNVVIWKEGEIDEGNEDDLELYSNMVSFISENDMTIEENYEKACELIDIDSFVDYYAAQIFISRCGDWPGGNEAAWRSRSINYNSKYQDGKWRWMLFDLNSEEGALDMMLLEEDTLEGVINASPLFKSLIQNESFKKLFCERLRYIENNIYSEEKVNQFIDNYYEQMLEPLCMSNMRFYSDERRDEIIENAENIRTFLLERHTYIDKSIAEHFGEEYLK